jgi:uncharacterized protein
MREGSQSWSIQPLKLARMQGEKSFNWPISSMQRLKGLLFDESGEVRVRVRGRVDLTERAVLDVELACKVNLTCQTTFEAIPYPIEAKVSYLPVVSESEECADEELEAVLMDEGYVDIKELVEDELILSLPVVANKPQEEITQQMTFGEIEAEESSASKKRNPFAVLADLKKT